MCKIFITADFKKQPFHNPLKWAIPIPPWHDYICITLKTHVYPLQSYDSIPVVTDMSIFLLPKGNSSWIWLWLSRRWLKYTCKTLFPIRKLCLHIVVALRGFTCTNMVTEILWCREGLKTYQQAPEKAEQWQPGSSDIHRNFDIIMSEDRISQKMFMKPHTWRP